MRASIDIIAKAGVDASMDEIAGQAGVNVATVYRNFPSKEALVRALLLDVVIDMTEAAQAFAKAAKDDDPWSALAQLLHYICELQIENRGLAQFFTGRISSSPEFAEYTSVFAEVLDTLVRRAQEKRQLGADVHAMDITVAMRANARAVIDASPLAALLARRHFAIIIAGLRRVEPDEIGGPLRPQDASAAAALLAVDDTAAAAFARGRPRWPR